MRYNFQATDVGFITETFGGAYPDVLVGGFRGVPDDAGDPTKFLMLQRSTDINDPDDEGPHFEWCDQINSCYNCATAVELTRARIKLLFDESADFYLDIDDDDQSKLTELIIDFKLDDAEFSKLLSQFENIIFKGCDYFSYRKTGD